MYSSNSVQIKYRRKIYENIAILAYARKGTAHFRRLPENIVFLMGGQAPAGEFSSPLDYSREACCAALGLAPMYDRELSDENITAALKELEDDTQGGRSNLCALKSVCRKCAQTMGGMRHCATVCPTGAITVDNTGSTVIDQEKCISCGKCMLACPNGAIIDKSFIYQLITSFKQEEPVYALLSPALHEQFEGIIDKNALTEAFRLLGFVDAFELKDVGDGLLKDCPYNMWRSNQSKAHHTCAVSNLAAINREIRLAVAALKEESPNCKVALIAACTRAKLIYEREKGLHVDYVLDFEELMGLMDARGIDNDAITLRVGDKDMEELKIID